ncbi:hypothetical protein P7D15_00660 [Bacillus cereus]|uniref:hypothetical protein n=1 Tax=Bacillus cereus TaxID=1396 RepID=UPI002406BB15|nr:hypothetical protein [Bacillus cereus]MDF9598958.1 hypothetical protein [Bacillus cereus]MDG1589291.1 hypothetical protein [Bacillus cereus]
MLELTEKEMEIVANKFELSIEGLKEDIEEENVRIFPSYEAFFYWLHDEMKPKELIKLMFEKKDLADKSEHIVLESGKTVCMI